METGEDRAVALRRRLALYREYLREGLEVDRAAYYLAEILRVEGELEKLEGGKRS